MEYKFGQLFKWSSGKPISATSGDIPIYGSNGIIGYTDVPKYENKIILGRVGAYCGAVSYCPSKFNATDNTLVTTCDTAKIEYFFAFYLLKLFNLNRFAGGAAQPLITQSLLKHLKCNIPDLDIQHKIAYILSTYDNLIENNTKRIKLLEQMAENLYKEWFVRFRFPGHENLEMENGLPKGWKKDKFGRIAEYFDSKRVPLSSMERDNMEKIYPYYGAASLMDYVNDYIFDGIYLLMGEDGSVISDGQYPMLQYVWGKIWVNNHAHVLQGKTPFTTEYLYMMLKSLSILDVVTGVAQPKISQGRLSTKSVIIPQKELIDKWSLLTNPMFEQIRNLTEQNILLARQRDILLPRLMSGELEVKP